VPVAGIVIEEQQPSARAMCLINGLTMRECNSYKPNRRPAAMLAAAELVALALAVTGLLNCGPAVAGKAHEHGAGKLKLVQDGAIYVLQLELPLDTVVGFERAPRTAAERQAAQAALARLRDPAGLFRTQPASAGCTISAAEIAVPMLEATAVPPIQPAHAHAHADATATYTLQCLPQAAPQRLEVMLFEAFPRIKRLELQSALASGQGRVNLTSGSRMIDLRR
jgi:hypothetical protein